MGIFSPADPEQRQENDLTNILAEIRQTNKLLEQLVDLQRQEEKFEEESQQPGGQAPPASGFHL
jgi:hypothetical protein